MYAIMGVRIKFWKSLPRGQTCFTVAATFRSPLPVRQPYYGITRHPASPVRVDPTQKSRLERAQKDPTAHSVTSYASTFSSSRLTPKPGPVGTGVSPSDTSSGDSNTVSVNSVVPFTSLG